MISELNGEVAALCSVRDIVRNGIVTLRFSQVTFLLDINGEILKGSMILWNKAADVIQQLHLGSIYRFKAVMVRKEEVVVLYYVPGETSFRSIFGQRGRSQFIKRRKLNAKVNI